MQVSVDDLIDKVKVIAQGPNSNALEKFIDYLYEQEGEVFSPEDLADIEEGFAQINRGESVTLEEMEKELGL
jgi:predicted transcriptional regulator